MESVASPGESRLRTRAELMAAYGLGLSTLEKWYRERAANGHPEAAATVGRQLAWDAEAWDRWYTARRAATPVPPGLLSRDELAAEHGLSRHALKSLWAERAANGHPEPAHQAGKALYWDAGGWAAWYDGHQAAAPGEPDELVTLAEAARLLGLAQSSVTVYVKRPPVGWPDPAEEESLAGGRIRRLYRRSDILAYARHRDPGVNRP
jgi:predicted DNA-binding transcriptional regulator AlpA